MVKKKVLLLHYYTSCLPWMQNTQVNTLQKIDERIEALKEEEGEKTANGISNQ
jgi:hypothetical protein